MKKLDHPNVVRLIEVLDDPTHDRLYIIMEYLQNGSLMKKLSKTKTSNLPLSWKYFRDLILGLNYRKNSQKKFSARGRRGYSQRHKA